MNREKALAKNTIVLAIGTILPKITALITLPILTEFLSKTDYGIYDLVLTLVALLLPVATLKIDAAAFRFLIECRDNKEETGKIISSIISFLIVVATIVTIVLFFVLSSLPVIDRVLIPMYLFFDIVVLSMQMIARGLSKNMIYSISAVINSVTSMLLIVIFVYIMKLGLTGVLGAMIIGLLVTVIYLTIKTSVLNFLRVKYISRRKLFEMLGYSWPMIPNSLSLWAMDLSDRFVITAFIGLEANAIYAIAQKIPNLFGTVQSTFTYAWQENASIAVNDGDNREYYSNVFNTVFSLMVGVLVLLIGTTPLLFMVLIRGDYSEAYYQMPLLFWGMLFSTLSSFMGGIYVAHKQTKSVGITTVIAAGLNLLIVFLLVSKIGIWAGSISTLISYLFLAVFRMIDVQRFQPIKYDIKRIGVALCVLLFMSVLSWKNTLITNIINLVLGFGIAIIMNKSTLGSLSKTVWKRLSGI